jgi:hypothetical protein
MDNSIPQLEYKFMVETAQIPLLPASQVAQEARIQQAPNVVCYASFGDTHLTADELEKIVQAVPSSVANALTRRAYYFVPLTIGEDDKTLVAPDYTVDLGDRAICHRNVHYEGADCIFISTRLMQDRFALAFEYFINVGHHFVEAIGVPQSFSDLVWSQAKADVRGESSQDAYESRRRALDRNPSGSGVKEEKSPHVVPAPEKIGSEGSLDEKVHDEKAKSSYFESAFSDALAVYMLSLTIDFDYYDLREREYPLLAAPALAERLRHVAGLFPPNPGYDFEIRYRRRS